MCKPHGIIVFGANGSGKTTLGRELERLLHFKHMDIEDYYFEKSEIPYTVERSREDCLGRMLADMEEYGSFVLSAVTGNFGDPIERFYELAVWLAAPLPLRLKRVEQREYEGYGDRVRSGGDLYAQSQRFLDFVATRSLDHIDQWAKTLTCPVVSIDGTAHWRINAQNIVQCFYRKDALHDNFVFIAEK